ncbi:uncharacterized protein G2W53_022201 [Senna tora]|uniref:Uncharacterized protein n=1 Tax=Senna tora TaxID=362788 RepID=A0A834TM96_9FABA|nr:uncharacterized protein G2W53_022201 [Senna tora]
MKTQESSKNPKVRTLSSPLKENDNLKRSNKKVKRSEGSDEGVDTQI